MFSNLSTHAFVRRHIQNAADAKYEIEYWGYAVRMLPCTNDAGSCEYLDAVYGMHEYSMVYTFIMWAILGGLLLIIMSARILRPKRKNGKGARQGFMYRLTRTSSALYRRFLLPESFPNVFPYTTRLQVLILAILCGYLIVFSLVGITYKSWVTPIKNSELHNIRSGIGGFADRIGAFAFALTPFTIALCSRDSILSLLTGIPYSNFAFLHRWTGRIILIQSFTHAVIWTVIEGRLYQPQPKVYVEWIKQKYMIWGIVAQVFITFLFVFSLRPVVRWTGYEFFRKSHLIVAGLYLGACWGHWEQLSCWMIASLVIMGFDLIMRTVRTWLIHFGYKDGGRGFGFRSIPAKMQVFKDPTGTILRMTFTHHHQPWEIGQHFYLTFPALSIWQSHPFTPACAPSASGLPQTHTYIIRARNGETGKLARLAEAAANRFPAGETETAVILMGPYGRSIVNDEVSNLLCISGGTGISYTVPVVMAALAESSPVQNIELVWTVRHVENLAWMAPELEYLKSQLTGSDFADDMEKAPIVSVEAKKRLCIRIFVTRPYTRPSPKDKEFGLTCNSPTAEFPDLVELTRECKGFSITFLHHKRPDVSALVDEFMEEKVEQGRTQVVGSGPAELGTQIRGAVAGRSDVGGVWRGQERGDVECVWDDRLG